MYPLSTSSIAVGSSLSGLYLLRVRGGKIISLDAECSCFLGQDDPKAFAGRLWTDALGLDDPAAGQAWLSGAPPHLPFCGCANGGVRWLRIRAHPTSLSAEWVLNLEDVTAERGLSERAILQAERFHAIIERSSEGVSIFDTSSKILYESPSNKRIHGYEAHELEGRTLIDFCHPDDIARVALRFKRLAEAPGVVETEIVRFRHKQGHYIYLEGTVLNATDDPRLKALVNNFRDVTARLQVERELRRAKNTAEGAQRLQQHFLANLSHEFKTPLTLIRGPLKTLEAEGSLSARHRQALEIVFRNVDRLDNLLTELIDLVYLEAGNFSLKANQRDLSEFIRQQVEAYKDYAEEKKIHLQCDAPAPCLVFFDQSKLEKVIGNLVGNALKFSGPGTSVCVRVNLRLNAEGVGEAEVCVSDEGPGMNKQTRERVFDRFFQGNSGSNQEGMGIGLAIAREMIEIHGGTLTVESELGMGTTFTFTMPLGCDHLDPDDIDIAETPEARPHTIGAGLSLLPADLESPEADSSTGPRPRLLLVEDNADMRAYLRMHLDFHYAVREAESGLAAIDALTEELPDIILSDVMMPGLNGIELCRKIKAEAAWKAIPIILLSAKASIDYRLEGLKAGADDYQPKPFSVSELLERLKSRLPAKSVEAIAPDEPWSQKLLDCIDEHMGSTGFNVQTLARKMGYSDRQLQRRVVERFGKTPAAFLLERRLENAHTAINNREFSTVAEVAQAVGLSPGYFSRRYRHAYRCDAVLFASPTAEGGEFSREG